MSVLPDDLQEDKFATRTGYEISPYLQADNTLKPFERPLTTWDAKQSQLITSFETVDLQLVEVVLSIENLENSAITDVEMAPRMNYAPKELLPDSAIQSDEMPFYFDGTDYPQNNHYYFMDMQEHENRQVRLLFAVAKDRLDEAYITFFGSTEQPYALKIKWVERILFHKIDNRDMYTFAERFLDFRSAKVSFFRALLILYYDFSKRYTKRHLKNYINIKKNHFTDTIVSI